MAKITPQTSPPCPVGDCSLQLGSIHLGMKEGRLYARHTSLAKPVEIDGKQIERMVLKQLREQVR